MALACEQAFGRAEKWSESPPLPPPPTPLNSYILNHSCLTFFPSPPPPEQPPSSEDPADAWFNAAGILLSLKHAAAERNARMGAPLEVVQWTPPGSDPSITQQQVCNLFAGGEWNLITYFKFFFRKIQLVVHYQCCVLIGWDYQAIGYI